MATNVNASFVFPANNRKLADKLEENLEHRFTNYEVFPIFNSSSFFQAWKKGLSKSSKKYLVLTHQDVEFISIPELDNLFTKDVGIVGPAGAKVVSKKEPWWFSPNKLEADQLSGSVYHITGKKKSSSFYGKYNEVVVLDGVCLVTTPKILNEVGIPKIRWAKWDYYDHVISFEYLTHGYKLETAPIKLVHSSVSGNRRPDFFTDQEEFVKQYL
jgi:hypothetical protein